MMKKDPRGDYYGTLLTWIFVCIIIILLGGTLLFAFLVPEAFTIKQ